MPRYEYIDHEGNAHVITAPDRLAAEWAAHGAELARTENLMLADRASGTVELSDERSRAA
jgi:hypothetical protein